MIEELEALRAQVGGVGLSIIQRAYDRCGRLEEFLSNLESQLGQNLGFYIDPVLFDKHPELADRFEKLARRQADERNFLKPLNDLWFTCILRSETDKAIELQNRYPTLIESLGTMRVSKAIYRALDRNAFERVVQVTEDTGVRWKALLGTLTGLAEQGRFEEVRSCLDFATSIGIDTTKIPPEMMRKLTPINAEDNSSRVSEDDSHREEAEARSA